MKGGESYRAIHQILAAVLREENGMVPQLAGDSGGAGGVCFESPVEFDVLGGVGEKIAGAAQRRSKSGLLHQGSVISGASSRWATSSASS